MRNLRDNATHRWGIGPSNFLVELGDAQRLYYVLLFLRETDRAAIVLDRDIPVRLFFLLCHFLTPIPLLPFLAGAQLRSGPSFEVGH